MNPFLRTATRQLTHSTATAQPLAVTAAGDTQPGAPLRGQASNPLPGRTAHDLQTTFPGVPATVTTALRGNAERLAEQEYFRTLTSPDVGAVFTRNARYARFFGAHPEHRSQPLPPGSVNPAGFLQAISHGNDEALRSQLDILRASLPAPLAAQLQTLHARLQDTPLQAKHFAEPGAYAQHEIDGRRYWQLVSDTQKKSEGQTGAMGQSMDESLFNLQSFVYFSVEPEGCGASGKTASRFGATPFSASLESIAPQLVGCSLFTRDFATQAPESALALFQSADGSTGDPALDARLRSAAADGPAWPDSDEDLAQVALAATEDRARADGKQPISQALSVYRYAPGPQDIAPPLALAVTHQTALVLTQCRQRLKQLHAAGLEASPASIALTRLLGRMEDALAHSDDASHQNFLMNHVGARPQLIVPASVVLPA